MLSFTFTGDGVERQEIARDIHGVHEDRLFFILSTFLFSQPLQSINSKERWSLPDIPNMKSASKYNVMSDDRAGSLHEYR